MWIILLLVWLNSDQTYKKTISIKRSDPKKDSITKLSSQLIGYQINLGQLFFYQNNVILFLFEKKNLSVNLIEFRLGLDRSTELVKPLSDNPTFFLPWKQISIFTI